MATTVVTTMRTTGLYLLTLSLVCFKNHVTCLKTHTAYTLPVVLKPGEITNSFHHLAIPNGPIAVYRFAAEVVEMDPANSSLYIPVPIYDAYLHHHVVGSSFVSSSRRQHSPMLPAVSSFHHAIGFGAGTESRGTPQSFSFPYAFITSPDEHAWIANIHIINTRQLSVETTNTCVECPCTVLNDFRTRIGATKKTKKTMTTGTTGVNVTHPSKPLFGYCNRDLVTENNTACFKDSYYGGLRCCEDALSCLSSQPEVVTATATYLLRYTIDYEDVVAENKPLSLASCCDATGNTTTLGAVEYDIPLCDTDRHPGCVHTLSTTQPLHTLVGTALHVPVTTTSSTGLTEMEDPHRAIDLVYAVGHQHRGGLGISLYDTTDNLLCASIPTYGQSDNVGDEAGYVVSMSTCTFDPPHRMRASDLVHIVALYNNTVAHSGVMSLFYLAIHELTLPEASATITIPSEASVTNSSLTLDPVVASFQNSTMTPQESHSDWLSWLTWGGLSIGVTVVAVVVVIKAVRARRNNLYEPLAA